MRLLSNRLFRAILSLVCLVMIGTLSLSLYRSLQKGDIVTDRKQALEAVKRENEELKTKLVEVKSEAFIESEARNKLGLVKEGETVVIIAQKDTGNNERVMGSSKSNWQQWVELFF